MACTLRNAKTVRRTVLIALRIKKTGCLARFLFAKDQDMSLSLPFIVPLKILVVTLCFLYSHTINIIIFKMVW